MATKNIVPRADAEGQLGTSTKGWGKIFLGGTAANIDVNDVSGTNTAGKSLTLISGASTGSGAGGSIVFQTAAAGGSGTSVNSHATVLTLDSAKLATFAGAVQLNSTLTVGVNDTGYDVKFFGATSGKSLLWDESADSLIVTGTTDLIGTTNLDIVDIDGAVNIGAEVTLAAANKIIFNDASQFIHASSNAILNLGATDEIDLTATAIDVNGTMDVSGNATFASNIGIGGGALQSYHANVTSALALDDQSSIFTRSNQLLIANNFYYGASDAGLAIEDGKSSAIFYDRDQLRLFFAASVNAGQPSSLQEKLSVSETGLLTIKDDLIIKTGGTIGGASDPDLLTLTANNLLINGDTVNNKINTLFASQNSSTAAHTSGLKFCNDGNGGIYYDSSADDLSIFANQASSNIFLRTAGTIALTLDSSQNATFAGNITATKAAATVTIQDNADSISGGTLALENTDTSVADNHESGRIYFYGQNDNTQRTETVLIRGMMTDVSDETEDSKLEIMTMSNGGQITSLTVSNDVTVGAGNLVIGTAGKGIDFSSESPSGSGTASALLDDYEEGSWTPALAVTSGSLTVTLDGTTNAKYVKIGKQVTCWFYILTDVFTPDTASALVQIDGQPFASEDHHVGGSIYYAANGFAGQTPSSITYATTTRVYLIYRDTADDYSRETRADDFTSGSNADQHQFWGMFHYTAAT